MTPRAAVSDWANTAVEPLLRPHGWARRGLVFERTTSETTQLIECQLSRGAPTCFINVGLVFTRVSALPASTTGLQVVGGRAVHAGGRLDAFVSGVAEEFAVPADLTEGLAQSVATLALRWATITDASSALAVLDLSKGVHKVLRAQLRWLSGDAAGALTDLQTVAAEFSERRNMTLPDLIARAGLPIS